jgi:predicted AlkP superfamily phosphohydrolase/phosphomutase
LDFEKYLLQSKKISIMSGRLLLIEWDAADWKVLHPLIDAGEMPALSRLVEEGASGELLGVQPFVQAMLCTSMMTGKRAWQHGICHSAELGQDERPVAVPAARRRSAMLWQMLAHHGKKSIVIGWPASHAEQIKNSIIVSDRYPEPTAGPGIKPWPPAVEGTYWPENIREQLDSKRVSPEEIGANVISHYIPAWKEIDQKRDRRLGQLRLYLAADYSHQTAALKLLQEEKWDFAAVRFPALAPSSRIFMPYHLSGPGGTSNQNFELYRDVIRAGCRILDNMLQQLVGLAGPDASVMVVSSHGVRTQGVPLHGFPANDNESWKSPYGIFAVRGSKFARDALLHGAGILDVAPTILTWFGLPIGDDMEGRVLVESFANVPEVTRVESWDSWIGISPRSSDRTPDSTSVSRMAVALRREADWNFVQSGLEAARYKEVLPVLDRMFREFPERGEVGYALFQCQLALNLLSNATETLEVVLESIPAGVASLLPRAELAVAQKDMALARSLVGEALKFSSTHPLALRKLGLLLLRLREWNALADIARKALQMDDKDAIAWLGLAAAQLRKGNAGEAEEAAARAIGLRYFLPDAHFILARALVAQGRWIEARETMQILLKLQPENRTAATYFKRMPQENS